jgi:hypothetical protein
MQKQTLRIRKRAEIVEEMVQQDGKAVEKRAEQAELVENAILGKRRASQTYPLGEEMLAKKEQGDGESSGNSIAGDQKGVRVG